MERLHSENALQPSDVCILSTEIHYSQVLCVSSLLKYSTHCW